MIALLYSGRKKTPAFLKKCYPVFWDSDIDDFIDCKKQRFFTHSTIYYPHLPVLQPFSIVISYFYFWMDIATPHFFQTNLCSTAIRPLACIARHVF